jgi:hypothetical protein
MRCAWESNCFHTLTSAISRDNGVIKAQSGFREKMVGLN